MKRRAFMKSALGVPLLGTPASPAPVIGAVPVGFMTGLIKESQIPNAANDDSEPDEALADWIAHGATEEQYRVFKAINEHDWPKDYEAETEFVEVL